MVFRTLSTRTFPLPHFFDASKFHKNILNVLLIIGALGGLLAFTFGLANLEAHQHWWESFPINVGKGWMIGLITGGVSGNLFIIIAIILRRYLPFTPEKKGRVVKDLQSDRIKTNQDQRESALVDQEAEPAVADALPAIFPTDDAVTLLKAGLKNGWRKGLKKKKAGEDDADDAEIDKEYKDRFFNITKEILMGTECPPFINPNIGEKWQQEYNIGLVAAQI
jgi:hypothetical protein